MQTTLFQFLQARRSVLTQHAWVALALLLISMAVFTGVAYGNTWSTDDWLHLYGACQVHTTEAFNRPLAVLNLYLLCPFLGASPLKYYLALLAYRSLNAFLVYLLIWQISPGQSLFAFACALSTSVLAPDTFFIVTLLQQNDHTLSLFLTLLTLNAFTAYLRSKASWRQRSVLLLISLVLVGLTPMVREATFPLLLAVPLFLMILDRVRDRPRWLGLSLYSSVIVLGAVRFVVSLSDPNSYSKGTFLDLNIPRMLAATVTQFKIGFAPPLEVLTTDAYRFRLALFVALGLTALSFLLIRQQIGSQDLTPATSRQRLRLIVWALVGLVTTWLGFAAFLPTGMATFTGRTQYLSIAGESLVLVSAIWLLSSFVSHRRWQLVIQVSGLLWLTSFGTVKANTAQQELNGYAETWQNTAYFFRSLANLAPAITDPTVFVYVENPATPESPFVSGWQFQYGIRYFFNDHATGLLPLDSISGAWNFGDAGIWISESWITPPHTYSWDQVIFITRDSSNHIYILDKLPESFLTAYRQSLYHPFNRILKGFTPPRIRSTFPILASPDWSAYNALVNRTTPP